MKYVVTVWFWFVFLVTAPVLFTLGALLLVVSYPFDRNRNLLHLLVCGWCHLLWLHLSPGWRTRIEGRELLPPGPSVLVVNHQSAMDILAVMGLFHPYKFVAKASLFSIPIVGWMMTLLAYVPIVRGSSTAMNQLLDPCRRWLRRGMSVLIFPEGTYSTGGQLLPFKRGAFQLAVEEHVPVVPVVVEGTTQLLEGDGPWFNVRASIRVRVLPPLLPESLGADSVELANRVRSLYETTLAAG
ncbi:1-acyl-sn-glycerol-3-phosphate acyltransferase [Myxococcus sp. K15C18031901]|uniref:lysophospholipid acyltransferase family protein n=1 Tax=Myxococcus dinghuensis TaxID=2906761 RepID=UPI0020A780CE|nr:lysophospholipid acyltransferase family protein [Myxococcus dinghuensis]MCP3104451.1 1-acyl-sn-glycerol-3-phosphate acyltransferase [Myxococcus dinghuensis]